MEVATLSGMIPRIRRRRRGPNPGYLLLGVSAAAAGGFAVLARQVARHETKGVDAGVRREVPKRRGRKAKRAAEALGPLGKPWFHGPVAALLAAYARPRSRAGAAAITMSSAGSAGLTKLFERVLAERKQPPGHPEPDGQSFPSGHAMETAAVALTSAYVLAREERADAWIAASAALALPVISGAGRLFLDRHWASDVAGGLLAGVSLAAACAAAYELGPD